MRLAWLTDIHLNFIGSPARGRFWREVRERCDAVAISGDIGESPTLVPFLEEAAEIVQKPIYFVLGNHDFYHGSVAQTRKDVQAACERSEYLQYLSVSTALPLTDQAAIIGHDGWADARLGDYEGTQILLNDHVLIEELAEAFVDDRLNKDLLLEKVAALAGESATHLERGLAEALRSRRFVIALTHVPPFKEASWFDGQVSGDDFLPFFASKTAGVPLNRLMNGYTQSELLVLCGHTHGEGEVEIRPNLRVLTGGAEYGRPIVQRVFDVD